ncbi:MAG: thiamine phosphate synthase [Chitinispirillales bacterium]|nr:thiamine phosphate synthase [Chitinispirillales bacterium]
MNPKIKTDFGFYSILTDPVRGYDYLAKLLVENEISFLQLRMKDENKFKILKTAENIRKTTQNSKTIFIVNDFVDIAKDCGADGVHLGQDDVKPDYARTIFGEDAIIGLSTHNINQTKNAQNEKIDYIGIGPVYPTPTKQIPDPVLGLEKMKEMVDNSTLPSVCIGGINFNNIKAVLQAGGHNFCTVRLLNKSENPKAVLSKILKEYTDYCIYN